MCSSYVKSQKTTSAASVSELEGTRGTRGIFWWQHSHSEIAPTPLENTIYKFSVISNKSPGSLTHRAQRPVTSAAMQAKCETTHTRGGVWQSTASRQHHIEANVMTIIKIKPRQKKKKQQQHYF